MNSLETAWYAPELDTIFTLQVRVTLSEELTAQYYVSEQIDIREFVGGKLVVVWLGAL